MLQVKVEKYLTPEQQKQKEEEEKAEEERRRREQGDNARERALDQMMVRIQLACFQSICLGLYRTA